MNRIEEHFSKIEKLYSEARDRLSRSSQWYSGSRTDSYIDDTVKVITKFQRELELLHEDTEKLSDEKTDFYVTRCAKNMEVIRYRLGGEKEVLGGVYRLLDSKKFEEAYAEFIKVRSSIYNMFEDVRLIYALRIYPIEEKMALRSELLDMGFQDVVISLEEAENNLAEKHLKDSLTRCREALEKIVSSTLDKEGKKSSSKFGIDIATLCSIGIITRDEKRLIEPTYSYLSEVAHGRIEKLTLGDVNYAMKETYMRIELLVRRYREFVSKQKSESS